MEQPTVCIKFSLKAIPAYVLLGVAAFVLVFAPIWLFTATLRGLPSHSREFAAITVGCVAAVEVPLLILILLAARWAQSSISRGFRTLSLLVPAAGLILCTVALTLEAPPIGLGAAAFVWYLTQPAKAPHATSLARPLFRVNAVVFVINITFALILVLGAVDASWQSSPALAVAHFDIGVVAVLLLAVDLVFGAAVIVVTCRSGERSTDALWPAFWSLAMASLAVLSFAWTSVII